MAERQSPQTEWPAPSSAGQPTPLGRMSPTTEPVTSLAAPQVRRGQLRKVRTRRVGCGIWLLALTSFLMVLLILAAGAGAYFYGTEYILPGVTALDVDLGSISRAEAAKALTEQWEQRTIEVQAGAKSWTVPPSRLGVHLDVEAMVNEAYGQARRPSTFEDVLQQRGRVRVRPVWSFDPASAEAFLRVVAAQVQVPPVNARLHVVDGRLETVPAVPGQTLDTVATIASLQQYMEEVLEERQLRLTTVPLRPGITDLSPVIAEINQAFATPPGLRLYDPVRNEYLSWQVAPSAVIEWLSFQSDPANPARYNWSVEQSRVEAYVTEQSKTLEPERYINPKEVAPLLAKAVTEHQNEVRARVYYYDREHTVKGGETISSIANQYGMPYPWLQQLNLEVGEKLLVGQKLAVPSPDVFLPLTPVENKRINVSITKQRVWVYENGALKWEWPASTGMSFSPTTPGIYQVQTHEVNAYAGNWDLWMPYFVGIYRPVPTSDFMNGFHGFPKRAGTQFLWMNDLGHPITYGCVLVSTENAKALYEWAEEGVIVEIQP